MKTINKYFIYLLSFIIMSLAGLTGCQKESKTPVTDYEVSSYNTSLSRMNLYADALCVTDTDVNRINFNTNSEYHAVGLFDLTDQTVCYSSQIHDKLYPASTTKIMTLYLALKYGNLSDTVTISRNATNVPWDSSKAYLSYGDKLSLEDLLYSLMLPSGNDSAVAVAEYISGDVDSFVSLMNQEARQLGATNTHFVNPHGYSDPNHYTTAYDLYLIFQKAVQNETFRKIVSTSTYQADVTTINGTIRQMEWNQSNQLVNGTFASPEGVTVIGGKTGTTSEAGACLVLYSENAQGEGFISIIMGAENKPTLYQSMLKILSTVPSL